MLLIWDGLLPTRAFRPWAVCLRFGVSRRLVAELIGSWKRPKSQTREAAAPSKGERLALAWRCGLADLARTFDTEEGKVMTSSATMRVRVPADVLVQELPGESVLLNLKNERYFGLDDMGTCMWKSLIAAPNLAAAQEALLADYDVDAEQLRRELQQFLEQLVEHGLVEVDTL
jgi:Coenzyme PQQ synthesis protein D (PqqD)